MAKGSEGPFAYSLTIFSGRDRIRGSGRGSDELGLLVQHACPGKQLGQDVRHRDEAYPQEYLQARAPADVLRSSGCGEPYQTVSTAPSFDQAGLVYKAARQLMSTEAMKPLIKAFRATPFPQVEFWNGSIMHVRSLHDDARYVDGHGYRYLSVDEAGWIPNLRKLVDSVLLMRLAGGGNIDLIGTPKGKNDLYWYFMQGIRGVEGYYSQRGSIYDNPYLPKEDLDIRARLLAGSDERLKSSSPLWRVHRLRRVGIHWRPAGKCHPTNLSCRSAATGRPSICHGMGPWPHK